MRLLVTPAFVAVSAVMACAGSNTTNDLGSKGASSAAGLSEKQVRDVVMAHLGQVRECYEVEAKRTPSLKGEVTMQWKIVPSGAVSNASVFISIGG